MTANATPKRQSSPRGLFLCFVLGLFLLQIAFAFTIHGDIGPQTHLVPGLDRPASPVLLGRIDALVSQPCLQKPVRPAPEAVMAPASPYVPTTAKADAAAAQLPEPTPGRQTISQGASRFLTYTVRKGDTLADIARKLYGTTSMQASLVRLNRIQDERRLRLGQVLKIPRAGLLSTASSENR